MNNVYAWMLKKNKEAFLTLLEGKRYPLFEHKGKTVYVSIRTDGWYALKDQVYFEFWYGEDLDHLGGLDQESGGCVQWPDQKEDDEDFEAQDLCAQALDKLFDLAELDNLKFSIDKRTGWFSKDDPEAEILCHSCKKYETNKATLRVPRTLDIEPHHPTAIDVHCSQCGSLIGWCNPNGE
jgi:hypothetical protein